MDEFYIDQKGAKNYSELISTDYYILYMGLIISMSILEFFAFVGSKLSCYGHYSFLYLFEAFKY